MNPTISLCFLGLGTLLGISGVVLGMMSLFSRQHRGEPLKGIFWVSKESFTSTEYALNRTGFLLSMAGIILLVLIIVLMLLSDPR